MNRIKICLTTLTCSLSHSFTHSFTHTDTHTHKHTHPYVHSFTRAYTDLDPSGGDSCVLGTYKNYLNKHNNMNCSLLNYLHPREGKMISTEFYVLAVKIFPPLQLQCRCRYTKQYDLYLQYGLLYCHRAARQETV